MMPDEDVPGASVILDTVVLYGAYAPAIWPLEVANALLVATRRGRIDARQRHIALTALSKLPIRIDETLPALAWTTLSEMTIDLRLTIYDAAYLELALRRSLPLATLDNSLRRAASSAGAQLFAPP
jgi:predicted nucleic acid-binding protein